MGYKVGDKEFTSKNGLHDYLRANKAELVDVKKAEKKLCDAVNAPCKVAVEKKDSATKIITDTSQDSDDEIYRTIVGNTYYYLDSHMDVHVKDCFKRSIQQRGASRIAHLHDHIYSLEAKVGKFIDVYEQDIAWRDLGVDKDGYTQALLADSRIMRKLNENIFDQYKDGDIDQHSVGMYYVRIDLALDDEDDDEHYKYWIEVIDKIANREDAEKAGYFWIIREAKLIEISAVIAGSNPITPTMPVKEQKAEEPPKGTLNKTSKSNYYSLIHNY